CRAIASERARRALADASALRGTAAPTRALKVSSSASIGKAMAGVRALRVAAAWAHYNQYRSTRCRDAPRASIRRRLSMNRMHRIASCLAALTLFALAPRAASAFTLTSAEVKPGGSIAAEQVYKGFGCTGENVSPSLAWKDPPSGTKSFAVTVYDPDAPTGSGWWHWVVFNLPASTHALPKGAGDAGGSGMPAGAVQSRTDFGSAGYGGPCP